MLGQILILSGIFRLISKANTIVIPDRRTANDISIKCPGMIKENVQAKESTK